MSGYSCSSIFNTLARKCRKGRLPFATLWGRACEEMFEIFDGLIAGWANTRELDKEYVPAVFERVGAFVALPIYFCKCSFRHLSLHYVRLEFLGAATVSDVRAVFGGDCLSIVDKVAVGALNPWGYGILVGGKTLVVSIQFVSLDVEFRWPAQFIQGNLSVLMALDVVECYLREEFGKLYNRLQHIPSCFQGVIGKLGARLFTDIINIVYQGLVVAAYMYRCQSQVAVFSKQEQKVKNGAFPICFSVMGIHW
ncbi:hypothetical protein IV203_038610 [Nitzschia inconspicua]|uniref:Uncharacterized protein n=1 Tax=Nitzschia inconspicua TaxID=303405 RepID=A0A9K3LR39_9STRA|nr:hypothetical protein IV203_038610 [Nitzschia inconspicua]